MSTIAKPEWWLRAGQENAWAIVVALWVLIALWFPFLPRSQFLVFISAQIFIMAIAAIAYNVLLGYTGLLSFGHAAFFGGSAYVVGLVMDYTAIREFFLLFVLGILGAFVLAVLIGYISVRYTGVYYALLMLALAQLLYVLVLKNYRVTGGTDGLAIQPPTVVGVDYSAMFGYTLFLQAVFYYVIIAIFVGSTILLWVFMHSPFGLTLKTIRDSPERAEALGIPVNRYRWYASIVSGTFTGVAGALFAFLVGHITPNNLLHWVRSGEIAFIAVLGGPGTFFGPAVGAAVFILLRNYIVSAVAEFWQFFLGAALYLVVVFMPEGIVGAAGPFRGLLGELRANGLLGTVRTRLSTLPPGGEDESAARSDEEVP